jgi:hypothetical protein
MDESDRMVVMKQTDLAKLYAEQLATQERLAVALADLERLRQDLLGDKAIDAMILAAANPVHDDGHTDTYYRGLMLAALEAVT